MKDTKLVIIDTSVVFKWFVDEEKESTDKAREILKLSKEKEIVLWAPDILLYEIANALSNKKDLPSILVKEAFQQYSEAEINIFTPTSKFISNALDFARGYQVTVYDASYAVLAREKNGIFITSDRIFVNQVKESFVELL